MSVLHEKLMSITRAEFAASLAAVAPDACLDGHGVARFETGDGCVVIRFEELPRRRLGGLVSMPQARVTLDFSELAEPKRQAFLRRFDIAFQRGGG